MNKNTPDKMMRGQEKGVKQKFFFPDHGLTVEAESMDEAQRILQASISK